MNPAGRPRGEPRPDESAFEPFLPDLSEGAETGVYLALLELLDEGILITGDETILDANSAACTLLERDYGELAGRPLAQLFPSERDFIDARARLFIQRELRGRLVIARPAGGERELQFISAPRLRPGIHALILSPAPDAASDADGGQAGDAVWPRLAAALTQPVIVVDDANRVTAANAAALGTLAMAREALVGRAIEHCLQVDWPAAHNPPVARIRRPDGRADIRARVLAGPRPGWRLLIMPPAAGRTTVPDTPLHLPVDVFDAASQAILVTDADNRIVAVNRAFTEITGYTRDEVLGANPSLLGSGRQPRAFYQELWQTLTLSGQWQGEIWNRRKNGEIFPEWLSITCVRDDEGLPRHFIAVFTDLTARRQAESRADYVARHDMLTGLPNRRLFETRFNEAVQQAGRLRRSVGVLRIDIDSFKSVNREYGDNTGDAFLQQIARRLLTGLPRGAVVARERSDTFLVLLPELDLPSVAKQAATELLRTFETPFRTEHAEVRLTASIGIALHPGDGNDFDTVLRHASAALQQARRLGGNNHQRYQAGIAGIGIEPVDLGQALQRAIGRDDFEVHFQPLVDSHGGAIRSGEALLRWRHPELGVLPFRHFRDAARDSGLLVELGDRALRSACTAAAQWPAVGAQPPSVTVNVATEQLLRGHLVELVDRALADSGLPATRLELDLDEGLLTSDNDTLAADLRQLAERGIRFSIDDFGRGVSSIARLRRYPVNAIKLDPGLVAGVGNCEHDEAIVEAIVAMAGALGIQVFARGVTDPAQQGFLSALGCHLQQGPLFGMPMTAEAFATFLAARAANGKPGL